MPRFYFCTFCDAMIPDDHPGIRFREPRTNAQCVRSMSDDELAELLFNVCCIEGPFECPAFAPDTHEDTNCRAIWLDWLKSAPEE